MLPPDSVEALLQWLCGGQNGHAESPRRIFGAPEDDKQLVKRVYNVLDATLFTGDDHLLPVQGTRTERERRYRLLVRAFHPDRFPELEKWLISRSQSVNTAYMAFRNNPDSGIEFSEQTVKPRSDPVVRIPERTVIRRSGIGEWLTYVTAPLSRSRYRSQAIMVIIAILCTLLLMVIYYASHLV